MKNLKKVMALLAVAAMTLSLAACGQEQTTVSSDDTAAEETTDAAETTEETTDAAEETTDAAASGDLFDLANYKSDKDESEWTIAVVTKDNTAAWFQRMEEGVNEFGEATGINVIQTGPANADAASQVQVIDDMIAQGVDALCVVPIDPGAIEASLQNAMEQGIVVVTHEASNQVNTLFDIEAFTAEDFGAAIMDALAADMGEEGKYAMMVAYTTSTTHMEYANAQYARQQEAYPNMELINDGAIPSAESEESIDTAYERAKEILNANPDLAGFTGVASTDCPGIAQAVEELGLNVKVVGVGTPNEFRPYVESGTISTIKLWDPKDAGYAMCQTAAMILRGEEVGEGANLVAPGYESVTLVEGDNRCLVGDADITITIDNIDDYDF
ncbi:LacI family transcriptional regulator [Lachnoclostridium sp. An131]|jgi:simple sugar transport system substrate-binding protein|uniref:autoinducer 2 ABC transporter substrate-binding protein n=1 Tax=Lachnoclostridium sp. An131 TaxID=1965555 RepID=UPI000B381626|nr:autoinducer 2 ABC transporter substrate-binding protein [Lachnoclostridium sp. An131]OUQ28039.1 LacI family transcriptional regulator [Lachnoclostridium sp. An131]